MQHIREMKIAILHTFSRNDSISIGALVIKDELKRKGYEVGICNYSTAFNYTHVLVSMTSTDDIFHIYAGCKKHNWDKRTFQAFVGGFGCQNPVALNDFIDYAFFGRVDGIIDDYLKDPDKYSNFSFNLKKPELVEIRQVDKCYPYPVIYGKNSIKWQEKFIGCPYRCKFCHYSHNRKHIGNGYKNDQISTSAEVMLKDITSISTKPGRLTTALDGYSERLRFKYGKKITWGMVEDALDHLCTFKGTAILKLYNIHNMPSETYEDRDEFFSFFDDYAEDNYKGDGKLVIEVFNTSFVPSINTPMERMPAKLLPDPRNLIQYRIYKNNIKIKFTTYTRGPYEHLKSLISIRYSKKEIIEFISLNKKENGYEMLDKINKLYDITPFIKEYSKTEKLPFKFIKDAIQ